MDVVIKKTTHQSAMTPFLCLLQGEEEDKISAFLVERSFGDIQTEPPLEKIGLRGLDREPAHY